jgi:hypothetical protein
VFDFVAVPELVGITGFRAGVVTLDLAEVDDTYRDEQRRAFGERSRSAVGHLRHAIGHRYWELLVRGAGAEDAFRGLFGDERADDRNALTLNLFHTEPHGLDDECLAAASAFADIATIAILQFRANIESHELVDQLDTALNTRVVIEQAKGIVAERRNLDMDRGLPVTSCGCPSPTSMCPRVAAYPDRSGANRTSRSA